MPELLQDEGLVRVVKVLSDDRAWGFAIRSESTHAVGTFYCAGARKVQSLWDASGTELGNS